MDLSHLYILSACTSLCFVFVLCCVVLCCVVFIRERLGSVVLWISQEVIARGGTCKLQAEGEKLIHKLGSCCRGRGTCKSRAEGEKWIHKLGSCRHGLRRRSLGFSRGLPLVHGWRPGSVPMTLFVWASCRVMAMVVMYGLGYNCSGKFLVFLGLALCSTCSGT